MKIRPFNSIGGLTLYLQEDNGNEIARLDVPRESCSLLAIHAITEIGMDASAELIQVCRDLVEAVDNAATPKTPPWRTLTDEIQETLFEVKCELIRDDVKQLAIDELDAMSLKEIAEEHLLAEQEDDHDPTDEEIAEWIKKHTRET